MLEGGRSRKGVRTKESELPNLISIGSRADGHEGADKRVHLEHLDGFPDGQVLVSIEALTSGSGFGHGVFLSERRSFVV